MKQLAEKTGCFLLVALVIFGIVQLTIASTPDTTPTHNYYVEVKMIGGWMDTLRIPANKTAEFYIGHEHYGLYVRYPGLYGGGPYKPAVVDYRILKIEKI